MRISESCVTSEDLRHDCCEATDIFCDRQIGIGPMLSKDGNWIGYVNDTSIYLGDDIIITEIVIYKNPKLSKELTDKYKGQLLICSTITDQFIS